MTYHRRHLDGEFKCSIHFGREMREIIFQLARSGREVGLRINELRGSNPSCSLVDILDYADYDYFCYGGAADSFNPSVTHIYCAYYEDECIGMFQVSQAISEINNTAPFGCALTISLDLAYLSLGYRKKNILGNFAGLYSESILAPLLLGLAIQDEKKQPTEVDVVFEADAISESGASGSRRFFDTMESLILAEGSGSLLQYINMHCCISRGSSVGRKAA